VFETKIDGTKAAGKTFSTFGKAQIILQFFAECECNAGNEKIFKDVTQKEILTSV